MDYDFNHQGGEQMTRTNLASVGLADRIIKLQLVPGPFSALWRCLQVLGMLQYR